MSYKLAPDWDFMVRISTDQPLTNASRMWHTIELFSFPPGNCLKILVQYCGVSWKVSHLILTPSQSGLAYCSTLKPWSSKAYKLDLCPITNSQFFIFVAVSFLKPLGMMYSCREHPTWKLLQMAWASWCRIPTSWSVALMASASLQLLKRRYCTRS